MRAKPTPALPAASNSLHLSQLLIPIGNIIHIALVRVFPSNFYICLVINENQYSVIIQFRINLWQNMWIKLLRIWLELSLVYLYLIDTEISYKCWGLHTVISSSVVLIDRYMCPGFINCMSMSSASLQNNKWNTLHQRGIEPDIVE